MATDNSLRPDWLAGRTLVVSLDGFVQLLHRGSVRSSRGVARALGRSTPVIALSSSNARQQIGHGSLVSLSQKIHVRSITRYHYWTSFTEIVNPRRF